MNDCILFGEATTGGVTLLKGILKEYESCSGQCVNFSKLTVFFSSKTIDEDNGRISSMLGMRFSLNLKKYLGLPNMVGRRKNASFQNLKDRVKM